ncbi:transglutaminaseTgpA domain-containing protein [Citricoccus sp. NPDC055426]|uniref:transglutaminase family protein n=1 Tax=Citricoccus sp. NPDC055426 TaxID=3155536 RepID=UPI00343BBEF2
MSPATVSATTSGPAPGPAPTPTPARTAGSLLRTVWLPALLVAGLVLAAAISLDAAFQDPVAGWLVPAAGPALVGLAVAAVVRSLGTRMLRPLATGLLAAGWIWCRQWWPETMLAGLVPRPATVEAMAGSTEDLRQTIWTEVIPVASTDALLAGLGAVLALTALVTDAIATGLRSPALAGIPPLALVGGAAALTTGTTPWPALAGAAAAWLALLAADPGTDSDPGAGAGGLPRRADRRATLPTTPQTTRGRAGWAAGWATVAAAAVGLLVLAAAQTGLPLLTTGLAPEGRRIMVGPGTGPVNPAADLSQQLRSGNGYAGISYRTEDGQGLYLRTAVVDDVMASPWDATPPQYAGDPTTTGFYPAAAHLSEQAGSPTRRPPPNGQIVSLTLDGWAGNWAPVPDQAAAVEPIVGDWGWQVDPTTSSAYREDTTPVDLTFDAIVLPLQLSLEQLAARAGAVAPQGVYNRWGAAGELEGSAVQELAEELTEGTDNPVEQAVAIQDHLLSDEFTYSETAPAEQGYDGSGLELTEQFLAAGAGYCIHFASAMAMMAQSVDIPARVVVGYAPVAATGGEHRVTADRAHAWPELYIDQVGWVPFEPTQTVGRTPSYAQQDTTVEPTPAVDPTAGAEATPSPSGSAQSPTDDAGPGTTGGSGTPGAPQVPLATAFVAAGVLLLVALVVASPAWLRHRRRARRLGSGSVAAAWAEVEDTAVDLGIGRVPHESEQVFAARLARVAGAAGSSASAAEAAESLAEAMVWVRYAPEGAQPPAGYLSGQAAGQAGKQAGGRTAEPAGRRVAERAADDARVLTAALEAAAEPAARRRARWFPRSLVPLWIRR